MLTFFLDWTVELFSSFFSFSCFIGDDDDGGGGNGFSSFTCVVTVGSFCSVINRRPSSFKPIDGNSFVEDNDGGGGIACTSSINFFLLIAADFFFCCLADDFPDEFVPSVDQTPDDAAINIIKIKLWKEEINENVLTINLCCCCWW